eukprot:6462331-Amphidinium_carterae.1
MSTYNMAFIWRCVHHWMASTEFPCHQETGQITVVVGVRWTRPFVHADTEIWDPHVTSALTSDVMNHIKQLAISGDMRSVGDSDPSTSESPKCDTATSHARRGRNINWLDTAWANAKGACKQNSRACIAHSLARCAAAQNRRHHPRAPPMRRWLAHSHTQQQQSRTARPDVPA